MERAQVQLFLYCVGTDYPSGALRNDKQLLGTYLLKMARVDEPEILYFRS